MTSTQPVPEPNRYKDMNVGEGVTEAELIQMSSGGKQDYTRTLLLRIREQYWSTSQVFHFTLWFTGLASLILCIINWDDAGFSFSYFVFGIGCSVIQALFPHGIKSCNKDAKFRPGEPCVHATDCTLLPQNQIPRSECQTQYGNLYKAVRMGQILIFLLGIVLVAAGGKTKKKTASYSWVAGFSVMYTLSYSLK